jgi:wyosine [tRNA(Phe)-imidazoG37] synthetase (radical SAM superfamily)
MNEAKFHHVYGPVPSRRLGRSLGIDLVPFKTCTYDCVYCQLGRTTNKTLDRNEYIAVDEVLDELDWKLAVGTAPNFITLAGSGEPTLHAGVGGLIEEIKRRTSIPVAVLTNGSLLWMPEVREALSEADLVLPSLDAGDEHWFRYVNRPHWEIPFEKMVEGLIEFTEHFPRSVWLEVFLLAGITGIPVEVEKIATLVRRIRPERVQLNTVFRPPAEKFACSVPRDQMEGFKNLFTGKVEVISESEQDESDALSCHETTNADILALLRRRPCTVQDVSAGLGLPAGEAARRLRALNQQGAIIPVGKKDAIFYEATRRK